MALVSGQVTLYKAILRDKCVSRLLSASGGGGDDALSAIMLLRKLCNHPDLLRSAGSSEEADATSAAERVQALFPDDYAMRQADVSGLSL